jgi:hypothetical protein
MFPIHHQEAASHLYIIQPSYDPVIEHYARGTVAHVVGCGQMHPGHDPLEDSGHFRMSRRDPSTHDTGPSGSADRGEGIAKESVPPEGSKPGVGVASDAGRSPGWWARWISRLSRKTRPDRAFIGVARLQTRN